MPVGVGRARARQATKWVRGKAQPSRNTVVDGEDEVLEALEEAGKRGGRRRRESMLLLLLLLTLTVMLLVQPRTTVHSSTSSSTPPRLHKAENANAGTEDGA